MRQHSKTGFNIKGISKLRSASFAMLFAIAGCITTPSADAPGFAAYGYLTPNPIGDGELLGVFATKSECDDAGDEWTSRQVVGNPISSECYPVDTD